MKRARFSEEQIITILKEAEGGTKVTELCPARDLGRDVSIPGAQNGVWRCRRCAGCANSRKRTGVKSIVADQALDIRALKDVLAKNGYGPR